MWPRGVIGIALCLMGALWFAQGIGVAKGSPMTNRAEWAWIGGAMVIVGIGLLVWAVVVATE